MDSKSSGSNVKLRIATKEDLLELATSATNLTALLDTSKIDIAGGNYFILTARYNNLLIGVLIAEKKIHKVDSLNMIVPRIRLHLIHVHEKYRLMGIGKKLLETFLKFYHKAEVASIYVKLPQKYQKGISFFLKHDFQRVEVIKNKIVLELNLWKDYGIRNCEIIDTSVKDIFE